MSSNKKTAKTSIDVRIILSALWAARMLCSLQGDVVRFMAPGALEEMIAGTTPIPVTNGLILVMSTIMAVPIFMSFLSLTLRDRINRRVNLGMGIFFVVWELVFLIFVYSKAPAFEMFWGITYLIFAALVVWYAWRWRNSEGKKK